VAQVLRAGAATPWRTVTFTRSINAVLSRPERPTCCNLTLRAASVPRRITCVTRTSLRQRSAFLHLTIDQLCSYLPLQEVPASATHLEPVSKMGREGVEVQV
jgi:hypothetical protein